MTRTRNAWRGLLSLALAGLLGIGSLGCDLSQDNGGEQSGAAVSKAEGKTAQRAWWWWLPPPRK